MKHIFKYLQRMRDYIIVYQDESLVPIGYIDFDFQSDRESRKLPLDMCSLLEVEPLVG